MKNESHAIALVGPSGSGKTTFARRLTEEYSVLCPTVSYSTREPGQNEVHAKDYYFIGRPRFKRMISKDQFLEWEEINGDLYGTPRNQVDEILSENKIPIFDIDVNGALRILQHGPTLIGESFHLHPIFLDVPKKIAEIRIRSRKRGESEEAIAKRLRRYDMEQSKKHLFKHVIPNIYLEPTYLEILEVIKPFLEKSNSRKIA